MDVPTAPDSGVGYFADIAQPSAPKECCFPRCRLFAWRFPRPSTQRAGQKPEVCSRKRGLLQSRNDGLGSRRMMTAGKPSFRLAEIIIPLPFGCSRPEPFPHLRQNLRWWASAIHHRASICAIDDWTDLPINEATIEQHDVAPMPPFLSLAVRPDRFLEELKILFWTAPRCPRNE